MMVSAPYLHALDGRLRIKIPAMKGAPRQALAVEQALHSLQGITMVTANVVTGNVLVLFDSQALCHDDIITMLEQRGYLAPPPLSAPPAPQRFTNFVLQSAVEFALERLVLAII